TQWAQTTATRCSPCCTTSTRTRARAMLMRTRRRSPRPTRSSRSRPTRCRIWTTCTAWWSQPARRLPS
ncbi:MAG: hypothetical protein ACLSVD_11430, partial [Eggerthellaceae bacterium]